MHTRFVVPTKRSLKASKADEDVYGEVAQMQNIVKCFYRPGDEEQRACHNCTGEVSLCSYDPEFVP